ncbi:MAG: molybdopterin molybdotransferase MoeA [Hyphomicrobiales bacterium]|nr:molybdopterin molybdotransferase MoeA [Hyphomicrobiales bacterium]
MTRRLLDDCFLHDKDRLTHDEALAILKERAAPAVEAEDAPLHAALGRVLAEPVLAPRPIPAFDNAAVDGYAFAHADYLAAGDSGLRVFGRAAAGHALADAPPPGSAARIFTGAAMPEGADTVAMQEDVRVEGARLFTPPGLKRGANRRKAGEDAIAGAVLAEVGSRLRPQDLAAIASAGVSTVRCFRPLRVAVFSSGDEVLAPGAEYERGKVYDANAPMLVALLELAGAQAEHLGVLPDDAGVVRARLMEAAERFDAIVTSGGASRGEEDHLVNTLNEAGSLKLWQIAVKPGRPMAMGQLRGCPVIGLPGNPVAAFMCFALYARPFFIAMGGGRWPEPMRSMLPAAFSAPSRKTGRREFWRGWVERGEGGVSVRKYERDGSGLISGLCAADGLIEIPEDVESVKPGELVRFIPFSQFGIQSR